MDNIKKVILKFEMLTESGVVADTLSAGYGYPDFNIVSVGGITGLDMEFAQVKSPQLQGSRIVSRKALPRQIDIVIDCDSLHRERVLGFFNPHLGGRLVVSWNDAMKWIDYAVYPVKVVQNNIHDDLRLHIRLVCPNPYLNSMDDYGKNIAQKMPLMAFPFVMLGGRVIADYSVMSTNVTLQNDGDVETGCIVRFIARNIVRNPRLTLNNGEYVRAVVNMTMGDVLEFNTNVGEMGVTLNGVNVLDTVDSGMTFFQIPVGESTIKYNADEGYDAVEVKVFFTPKYLGI